MASSTLDLDLDAVSAASDWLPDLFVILWPYLHAWMRPPRKEAAGRRGIVGKPWPGGECAEFDALKRILKESQNPGVPEPVIEYLREERPLSLLRELPEGCRRLVANVWERPLTVALAIDAVFESIHPWARPQDRRSGRVPPVLDRFRAHLVRHGRFNRSADGPLLVPTSRRWVREARQRDASHPRSTSEPAGARFQFVNLTVFTPSQDANYRVEIRRLPPRRGANPLSTTPPLVAVVPLAQSKDEVLFRSVKGAESEHRYSVTLDDDREAVLAERVRRLIPELERAGVTIAVFPELVVSSGVATVISQALQDLGRVRGGRPSAHIELVVAGSGSTEVDGEGPFNQCVVLDGEGRVAWVQRKMNHYAIPGDVLSEALALHASSDATAPGMKASLAAVIEPTAFYKEDMEVGDVLEIRDGILGRMIVAICEDLSQPDPLMEVCSRLPPDWVFSPVMDTELAPYRWSARRAFHLADQLGTRTVVANSLAVPDAQTRAAPGTGVREVGIGLCVDHDGTRTRIEVLTVPYPAARGAGPLFAVAQWNIQTWGLVQIQAKPPS